MKLIPVNHRKVFESGCEVAQAFYKVEVMVQSLEKRDLPEDIVNQINVELGSLCTLDGTEKELASQLTQIESRIFLLVNKELGLVREKFYTVMWLPLGMSVFGLPVGIIFYAFTGNAAFIGIGLPLGMAVGALVGRKLDKKAKEQNRVI